MTLLSYYLCPKTQDLPILAIYAYARTIFICPVHLALRSLLTPKCPTPSHAILVFELAFTMSICHVLGEAKPLDEYAGLHHVLFHGFAGLLEPFLSLHFDEIFFSPPNQEGLHPLRGHLLTVASVVCSLE